MKKWLYILLLPIILLACKPDTGCRTEVDVRAGVSVQWLLLNEKGQGIKQNQWDTVSLRGIGSDSVLYNNVRNLKLARLPLRQDSCLTEYSIEWHGKTDVLHIKHQNNRTYLSLACGCTIYHMIDSVWSDGVFIREAEIMNSAVENYEQENIKLYLE